MTATVCCMRASATTRVVGPRAIMMMIAAVMAPPAISEAKAAQHCADQTQLRGRRLGIHNDKGKRESAEQ